MQNTTQERELLKLSEDWANAELQNDPARMHDILADSFVAIGPRGFMLTKKDWFQRYASGDLKNETFVWDEVTVRMFGESAIVIGRQTSKGTYQNNSIQGQFRASLFWVKQNDQWLIAGLHLSPIVPMLER